MAHAVTVYMQNIPCPYTIFASHVTAQSPLTTGSAIRIDCHTLSQHRTHTFHFLQPAQSGGLTPAGTVLPQMWQGVLGGSWPEALLEAWVSASAASHCPSYIPCSLNFVYFTTCMCRLGDACVLLVWQNVALLACTLSIRNGVRSMTGLSRSTELVCPCMYHATPLCNSSLIVASCFTASTAEMRDASQTPAQGSPRPHSCEACPAERTLLPAL